MKINFTNKQFKNLIYLCALGAQIIQNSGDDTNKEELDTLEYVLTFDKDDAEFDISSAKDLEDIAAKIIESSSTLEEYLDNYNENIFWSKLASKMASRDIVDKLDNCIKEGMNYAEYIDERKKLQKKYYKQFKKGNFENDNLPY